MHVLQRPDWYGEPKELGDLFRLSRNGRSARAALWSHQLGWEIRVLVGRQLETVRSQVCRSQDEVLGTAEQWEATMIAQGWRR
jgi:hypothetical protein